MISRWITSLDAAVQVYRLQSAAHTLLEKLPAGHQSKLELVFCFFCLHSLSLKGNRTPCILSILHGSIQTLEEEFVYVDVLSL